MLKLSADEVGHEDQTLVGSVAAGSSFSGLDQVIRGLQKAVAQLAALVAEDVTCPATFGPVESREDGSRQ